MSYDFWENIYSKTKLDFKIQAVNYYDREDELEFILSSKHKDEDVEDIISHEVNKLFPSIKTSYNWQVIEDKNFSKEYIDELISSIREDYDLFEDICNIFYDEADKTLIIEVKNIYIENKIIKSNIKEKIIKRVKAECDIDFNVSIELLNDIDLDEYVEESKKIENSLSEEKIKDKPINLNKEVGKSDSKDGDFYIGKKIKTDPISIEELNDETFWVTVEGCVYGIDSKAIKNNKYIVTFYIHDSTGATTCKAFWSEELYNRFTSNISEDDNVIVSGRYQMDSYSRSYVLMVDSMVKSIKKERIDNYPSKRVELRVHTQMTNLDGFTKIEDLYKMLKSWGHKSVAITDRDVVQSFPNAMKLSEEYDIKTLYGMDASVVDNKMPIVNNYKDLPYYVVFDIETTGLANRLDKITEIGAVKIKDGEIIDNYSSLLNPEKNISEKIVELTGITNEMVAKERTIDQVLPEFFEFCKDSTLVAHNAEFDISNLRSNANNLDIEFDFPYVDTLYLARFLIPELKNHRLNTLAKHLNVKLINHHRAVDDAYATAEIFIKLCQELKSQGLVLDESLNYGQTKWPKSANNYYNMLILAKNNKGLKNLYKIVSESHTNSLYKSAKVPIDFLENHRDGLLLGSGNIDGIIYQSIFNSLPDEYIENMARKFDFLEVQPRSNFENLVNNSNVRTGIEDIKVIDEINKYIVDLGERLGIPVIASGDVYYLNKGDHIFREIVKAVKYNRPSGDSKNLYFKSTDEMLDEFSYLGQDKAKEIVIDNTNYIDSEIDNIRPIPKGKFAPKIDGADEDLRRLTYTRAKEIYGDILPKIVEDRIEVELNSIISNGYAVLYMIARKLVAKSNDDGYVVGSRGSVGSSLVATLANITEVNPLAAHYVCPNCKNSEFFVKENYDTGLDMEDKLCPKCSTPYKKDGHNIPFEVFLGFEGNKEPDIDLNFASEYQAKVHKYTEELFGEDYIYRAGTIGTIADNTAFGYIKKYFEKIDKNVSQAEIAYLQRGIVGTKRTTGQHPGGIMIVPHENEIEDFTPINYPADDETIGIRTTHFAYSAIEETILKLDLLGHDVPSIIKRLKELTSIDPESIELSDEKTMSIFNSMDALELKEEIHEKNVGTLGIPEFGTAFVRQMLTDTKPSSMGELFRISGLSHGTDVWLNNAQILVREGRAVLSEVICTRDDIMTFLIQKGMDSSKAFTIMERVRKGRGLTDEQIDLMNSLDLPDWYIDSCLKIKYMFPKAHATAYVLMSFRIAYFKVHQPLAFYATYFTTKLSDFPGSIIFNGLTSIKREMERIRDLGFEASNKEINTYAVLELAEEMYARGYEFERPKLGECTGEKFAISKNDKLVCPYCAIEEVSLQQSIDLYEACKDGDFISIEDLVEKTSINKTAVDGLKRHGLLDGLQETNQIDIFSILD